REDVPSPPPLMSEWVRTDGRIWVPTNPDDDRPAGQIPEPERDYYLERIYPAFGNLVPRDVASRAAMRMIDQGRGVGKLKNGVFLDFGDAIGRLGADTIEERYGNLFEMYDRITDENPYQVPMRIYPAPHYTMGGLWVDYNLMTTVPGLFAIGEANFSDHGANRLGASALMQGLADGYFVLPYTIGDYLADFLNVDPVPTSDDSFREAEAGVADRVDGLLGINGTRTVDYFHRELGKIMIEQCGMARSREGLEKALSEIPALREEFRKDVRVLGDGETMNQSLEKAGRVADFLDLGELMCRDALDREESCGGHFRLEHQTDEGEALRDDERFAHVSAWAWEGPDRSHTKYREELTFDYVALAQRSYK
ncbi:MAG: FAD-binding protein, partial [Acidimicrobiia bacterium]